MFLVNTFVHIQAKYQKGRIKTEGAYSILKKKMTTRPHTCPHATGWPFTPHRLSANLSRTHYGGTVLNGNIRMFENISGEFSVRSRFWLVNVGFENNLTPIDTQTVLYILYTSDNPGLSSIFLDIYSSLN